MLCLNLYYTGELDNKMELDNLVARILSLMESHDLGIKLDIESTDNYNMLFIPRDSNGDQIVEMIKYYYSID